jgi:hypothetical protein
MRPRYACALVLASALLALAPAPALAVTAKPVTPAGGASVTIVPKKGFANGDARLTWTIDYGADCPGPDSIHSSWVEVREPGYDWGATQREGPFLGNGTFTTPANFFPGKTARKVEWRVSWACGATENFAGLQGRSNATFFMLQPAGATATTTSPCSSLTGKAKTRCLAKQTRDKQLAKCAAIKAKAPRDACVKKARDVYARAIKNA